MSEDKVQEKAQEMTTQSQNSSGTDNRESELLHEVMQKKERLNSAIERADTLQSKYDDLQKQVANEQESQKIKEMESKGEYDKFMLTNLIQSQTRLMWIILHPMLPEDMKLLWNGQ